MKNALPKVGMRMVKTAVAVMLCYGIFAPFGLIYRSELGGVWGQLGPLYACIASIVCTQSSLGQTMRQGVSRFIGVAVGGALGAATLLLGEALEHPVVFIPLLGVICVAGIWICLLLKRPAACPMACIVPCVILITGVTGEARYYYAAARIIETVVGVAAAFLVNAILPDHRREEPKREEACGMQVALENTTRKLCVIGDPVAHSKSPLIQNTMLRALGLDYVYLCQSVPRGACARWLECARFAGYAGFNATMPHKEELVPLMDELDADAAAFGAVNTVCIRDGKYYGYNTDGKGFIRALCALDPSGVLRPAGFDGAALNQQAGACDLLVNCTSLGMEGAGGQFEDFSFLEALPAHAWVCDLIYAPEETELLRRARARGLRGMNGLGLLIHQAILSLEHFTGAEIEPAAVYPLVEQALHTK